MKSDTKSDQPSPELLGGTVTFLFTDIAGSTELIKHLGAPQKDSYKNSSWNKVEWKYR
ncbi:MAG: hypothetical protein GTO18_20635 [Anaerolineales bacterium]|nr:hypothetical protein [Anaerolineales bacterium]